MSNMTTITIRIDKEIKEKIEKACKIDSGNTLTRFMTIASSEKADEFIKKEEKGK